MKIHIGAWILPDDEKNSLPNNVKKCLTFAPNGYNLLTTNATLVVTNTDTATTTGEGSSAVTTITKTTLVDANIAKIQNNKGTVLPSTGGMGTTIFYIIGAVLVIGVGVILITCRRMQSEK